MQSHQLDQQKGEMDARRAAVSKEHTERLKVLASQDSRQILLGAAAASLGIGQMHSMLLLAQGLSRPSEAQVSAGMLAKRCCINAMISCVNNYLGLFTDKCHVQVEKERESISAEATLCKQQLAEAEAALATHKAETKRLGELLQGADQVCCCRCCS